MADKDIGKLLQEALTERLIELIGEEEVTHGVLEVARKLLIDNQVSSFSTGLDEEMETLGSKLHSLPFRKDGENPMVG